MSVRQNAVSCVWHAKHRKRKENDKFHQLKDKCLVLSALKISCHYATKEVFASLTFVLYCIRMRVKGTLPEGAYRIHSSIGTSMKIDWTKRTHWFSTIMQFLLETITICNQSLFQSCKRAEQMTLSKIQKITIWNDLRICFDLIVKWLCWSLIQCISEYTVMKTSENCFWKSILEKAKSNKTEYY